MTIKTRHKNSFFLSEDFVLEKELVFHHSQSQSLQQRTDHLQCITFHDIIVYIQTSQIIAKEVILRDIDISSAIVKYITNNSIANLVVGASARNSFLKSLLFSLYLSCLLPSQLWLYKMLTAVSLL